MQSCLTDLDPITAARRVADERFAWPGGYALGILTADGGCICSACVAENLDQITDPAADPNGGWKPAAAYYTDADDDGVDGDGPTLCDHCGRPITDATTR